MEVDFRKEARRRLLSFELIEKPDSLSLQAPQVEDNCTKGVGGAGRSREEERALWLGLELELAALFPIGQEAKDRGHVV